MPNQIAALDEAALDEKERELLARLVERLRHDLGDHLLEVLLYGSRARGERHAESDIDLLVVVDDSGPRRQGQVSKAAVNVAFALGLPEPSAKAFSKGFLAKRRAIKSFFVQEVDRDGIRLYP